MQSLFFDQGVVLGTHKQIWLVEQFFYETMGLSYANVLQYFEQSAPAMQQATMRDVIERRISKASYAYSYFEKYHQHSPTDTCLLQLMVPHVRSNWYNPPRRRRHLMKEVLQWHMLYDVMLKDVSQHKPPVRFSLLMTPCPSPNHQYDRIRRRQPFWRQFRGQHNCGV